MATTSTATKKRNRSHCSEGKTTRRCRAFRSRTLDYLQRALDGWSSIFEQPRIVFDPVVEDCSALAKAVKSLLADCPSSLPRAVLSYQSIKKGLPDSCSCMESALLDGLVDNIVNGRAPSLPVGYLQFVKREVSRLFPKGWDTAYEGHCRRFSPSLKSCLGVLNTRSGGGALRAFTAWGDYSSFLEVTLFGRDFHKPFGRLTGALQVVQSAGKPRPLTSFSMDGHFLKPLHKTIYGHLSKKTWLLRGDLAPDKLARAGFRRGMGPLTSGDYASATDNLSIEVMEAALGALLDNCAVVPGNIRAFAHSACRPLLCESVDNYNATETINAILDLNRDPSWLPELSKGQMMGSYLSFPFLCLQNYLAFRWSTRRERKRIPVLINGDDILFQSSRSVSEEWMEVVGSIGLQVERTKTSVSDDWGTLNSTLVDWDDSGRLQIVPTYRFGMLRPSEYPNSLGRTFSSFLKGSQGSERYRAGRVFFDFHLGEMKSSSYSLPSLGFRGSLAHRLARIYGLLSHDRLVCDPCSAPARHSVCLPPDLVSEVPLEFVSDDVREVNACEVACWKWQHGWRPSLKISEAVSYAISATRWTDDSDVQVALIDAFDLDDRRLSYRYCGGGRLGVGGGGSRRTLFKPFMEPLASRVSERIHVNLVNEMLLRTFSDEWIRGPPPPYTEVDGG